MAKRLLWLIQIIQCLIGEFRSSVWFFSIQSSINVNPNKVWLVQSNSLKWRSRGSGGTSWDQQTCTPAVLCVPPGQNHSSLPLSPASFKDRAFIHAMDLLSPSDAVLCHVVSSFYIFCCLCFITVKKQPAVCESKKCESWKERPSGGLHGHATSGLETWRLPQWARQVLPTPAPDRHLDL